VKHLSVCTWSTWPYGERTSCGKSSQKCEQNKIRLGKILPKKNVSLVIFRRCICQRINLSISIFLGHEWICWSMICFDLNNHVYAGQLLLIIRNLFDKSSERENLSNWHFSSLEFVVRILLVEKIANNWYKIRDHGIHSLEKRKYLTWSAMNVVRRSTDSIHIFFVDRNICIFSR
jgi:hypothetical protein